MPGFGWSSSCKKCILCYRTVPGGDLRVVTKGFNEFAWRRSGFQYDDDVQPDEHNHVECYFDLPRRSKDIDSFDYSYRLSSTERARVQGVIDEFFAKKQRIKDAEREKRRAIAAARKAERDAIREKEREKLREEKQKKQEEAKQERAKMRAQKAEEIKSLRVKVKELDNKVRAAFKEFHSTSKRVKARLNKKGVTDEESTKLNAELMEAEKLATNVSAEVAKSKSIFVARLHELAPPKAKKPKAPVEKENSPPDNTNSLAAPHDSAAANATGNTAEATLPSKDPLDDGLPPSTGPATDKKADSEKSSTAEPKPIECDSAEPSPTGDEPASDTKFSKTSEDTKAKANPKKRPRGSIYSGDQKVLFMSQPGPYWTSVPLSSLVQTHSHCLRTTRQQKARPVTAPANHQKTKPVPSVTSNAASEEKKSRNTSRTNKHGTSPSKELAMSEPGPYWSSVLGSEGPRVNGATPARALRSKRRLEPIATEAARPAKMPKSVHEATPPVARLPSKRRKDTVEVPAIA